MPPKKVTPTRPAPKKTTPTKPGVTKPPAGRGSQSGTTTSKTTGSKQVAAAAGPGKKAVPVKSKTPTPTSSGKGNVKSPTEATPKKHVWTEKDKMARKIQNAFRVYRCRKKLLMLKKKKEEFDALMETLEREAYLQLAKMERERAERELEREAEEKRKRKEKMVRQKKMLEAAFDGENDVINSLIKEVEATCTIPALLSRQLNQFIDCTDANNNTPLSEASAGGHADTIKLLLGLGANPNSRGQFGRTPLYRAAFAGHLDAVQALLDGGADPRIVAEDGANPEQVSSGDSIETYLHNWDVGLTEKHLKEYEEQRDKRNAETKAFIEKEENSLNMSVSEAEKENSVKQKQVSNALEELNKRIYEHDKNITLGGVKEEVTLKAIHDAEEHLAECKIQAEKAKEKLDKARLRLREKMAEHGSELKEGGPQLGIPVSVKELDDVLFRDVGNKMASDGRWPLVIDLGKQCATFLKYRDTNYLCALSPRDMECETIRLAILGALRYGKFAVLDLLEYDVWDAARMKFDTVKPGLLDNIMSKQLLEKEMYLELIKSSDGEEYSPVQFLGARIHNFKFVILTQSKSPPHHLLDKCYVIEVVPNQTIVI